MKSLNDILGYKNRKIFQDSDFFSFSLDSVMLANFVTINYKYKHLLDLGTGNGAIPLIISLRTDKHIDAVEIQSKLCSLATESVIYNNLEKQISIINCDMKEYACPELNGYYDVITCNPPYFKYDESKFVNERQEKLIARHEFCIKLDDILCISKKLLKDGGRLAIVQRTDRFLEIVDTFRKYGIEPKRIRLVYENNKKNSILFLIEGIKNGRPGIIFESPMVMYNFDGSLTDEYNSFLKEVKK